MSDQTETYLKRAAMLIELASAVADTDLRCALIDTAMLYERLADFSANQDAKQPANDAREDHGQS